MASKANEDHLNDTLSTSPFGQKESIDILSRYLKY
jgi:hypothetical protein